MGKHFVGTLSTFTLLPEGVAMDHSNHEAAGTPPKYVFDVTRLFSDLKKQGLGTGELKLTSKELSGSIGDAMLKLGDVKLIETISGPAKQ